MSGNQSAAVYLEYILSELKKQGKLPANAVMYNTIVTSDLGELVSKSYGVEVEKTLTGFKFIGDKIRKYEKTKEKVWDNYELYWYSIPSFTYVEKSGAKVVEGSKKINTDDLIERAAIESFFNTLENTYTEHIESTKDGEYSVYANSRTTASITYTIVTTEYNVVKQAVTKADADALGSIKVDDYTTSKLSVSENQDIPGHGHSHGHGHGHGEGNAGGGVGELD